jgi:hypothetical protein
MLRMIINFVFRCGLDTSHVRSLTEAVGDVLIAVMTCLRSSAPANQRRRNANDLDEDQPAGVANRALAEQLLLDA